MIHYELILFYQMGFKPSEMIRLFGYKEATAYRFHKIYQNMRKYTVEIIKDNILLSLKDRKKANNRDQTEYELLTVR